MSYQIQTQWPAEEIAEGQDHLVKTTKKEFSTEETAADVVNRFSEYRRQGYKVNVKFNPAADEEGDSDVDPFEIAEKLDKAGVAYKATLKVNFKGNYDEVHPIAQLAEKEGFDFTVSLSLKANEASLVNFDRPDSWTEDDGKNIVYKVTPKASSDNALDLKSIYTALAERGFDVDIDLKPKPDTSGADEDEAFAQQLAVYPEDTEVTFSLKEDEF